MKNFSIKSLIINREGINMKNNSITKSHSLNIFILAMMNVAVIMSLRGIPVMAKEGLIMYILLFASAIRLKYTQADVPRAYNVPGGKLGMWIVS